MRLRNRISEIMKDYIVFPDLLYSLSSANNEPLYDVIEYLSRTGFEMLSVFSPGPRCEMLPNQDSRNIIYSFLENVGAAIPRDNTDWVLADDASLDLLGAEVEQEFVNSFKEGSFMHFKVSELLNFAPLDGYLGFLEPETVSEGATSPQGNNSLASYMTEYTLPQVVALILHIDLADITTRTNDSYIHNQNNYDESVYHKFTNLLQSYSVAALNNQFDGVDLHTRSATPYEGDTEAHVDLEKTTISRGKLTKYLDSIGYQLNDLIAKQEPAHTQYPPDDSLPYCFEQQDDSELVSSLQQQVADLQSRLDEKDKELETNSKELDKALNKVKHLSNASKEDKPLSDNTANDYQVTIGMLLELLRTPKGFDKDGEPNKPLFSTQGSVVTAITGQCIPNHKETKVSDRFTASMRALSEAKKDRGGDLKEKSALAEKLKKQAALSA